jgi:signal transduction histidine kinase
MNPSPPSRASADAADHETTVPLQRALFLVLGLALLVGFLPAGVILDRWLGAALEARARADLALAPRVLAARATARNDALMMHAKELAHDPALAAALARDDRSAAGRAIGAATLLAPTPGAHPLVVRGMRQPWTPAPWWSDAADSLVGRTVGGAMPVAAIPGAHGEAIQVVALAPVVVRGRWVGAAGYAVPVDSQEASLLGALTRSDVVIVSASTAGPRPDAPVNVGGNVGVRVTSTLDPAAAEALRAAVHVWRASDVGGALGAGVRGDSSRSDLVRDVAAAGRRYFVVLGELPGAPGATGAGTVLFARAVSTELALLPALRRLMFGALAAVAVVLLAGVLVARRVVGSVRGLADAADATAAGDFAAPFPRSRIREVRHVSRAFGHMRGVLDIRLRELEAANAELAARAERLAALQAQLIQRDRLVSAGRLVASLAHEIRNPVASLRNCLELLRRRVADDPEAAEFADLAIDELLRMHELAERMLDVHRPHATGTPQASCGEVAHDVAALVNLAPGPTVTVAVRAPDDARLRAAIAPDALRQVLLNLVQNAREAVASVGAPNDATPNDATPNDTTPRDAGGHVGEPAVTVVVDVAGAADGAGVAVTVLDSGPGIAADVLPHVFDPFFTTKSAVRGVGLGLFVAEGLVRSAGGRLTAGNRPVADDPPSAHGAWFRAELPRGAVTANDATDEPTGIGTRGASGGRSPAITR